MIQYTDRLTDLMRDIVSRVPALSFIDMDEVLVFARLGRTGSEGAYATCHSLNLPNSQPGYYFWRDRASGQITRRSEWFVTKTPEVVMRGRRIQYLISFGLPRFCDQTFEFARKAVYYEGMEPWVAKIDTIVHELYHIDPEQAGIRRMVRADGGESERWHSPEFFEEVAGFVRQYLDSNPDPALREFLHGDFGTLVQRYGDVLGTTFRNFPSYPQRYTEAVPPPPGVTEIDQDATIVPLKRVSQPARYTEADLCVRVFDRRATRRGERAA
jgi:hypothetical protein